MRKVVRRILIMLPAVFIQLLWLFALMRWLSPYAAILNLALSFLAVVFVLYIITSPREGTYKTLWLLVILGLPVFGAILYLFLGNKRPAGPLKRKLKHGRAALPAGVRTEDAEVYGKLADENLRMAQTLRCVEKETGFPLYPCEEADYYPLGEKMYEQMLIELERAERFIYAEYFIIANGVMWDSMVEILSRKAAGGVDVRVLYDDLGSISTYSRRNARQLEAKGIRCISFNPMFFIRGTLNYRDHRKMLIIDGRVAFSGGVNMADEYINQAVKYGHWKDIGFRITGAPVQNYTRMFAEFWNACAKDPVPARWLEPKEQDGPLPHAENGYVLSYYDSPLYQAVVSNNLYVELLSQATRYAWFYTPYLMLGDSLRDAFARAAQRGVDVRIIMPGIPDKKLVYRMSRSYYPDLLAAGVRIYEYIPGFVHAKGCVIDDTVGTIGTVNLDYRSLFLHFENNSLFYRAALLKDLKADFAATQERCRERTPADTDMNFGKWLLDGVLRIFAPLC